MMRALIFCAILFGMASTASAVCEIVIRVDSVTGKVYQCHVCDGVTTECKCIAGC